MQNRMCVEEREKNSTKPVQRSLYPIESPNVKCVCNKNSALRRGKEKDRERERDRGERKREKEKSPFYILGTIPLKPLAWKKNILHKKETGLT